MAAPTEKRFVNIKRKPFQLTYYKQREVYVLQKAYWYGGMKFVKVGFKKEEIKALAELMYKIKTFNVEYNKIRKQKKQNERKKNT